MKAFSRFLNIVTFAMLFCTANQVVANDKEDVSLEPICCIDGRLEKANRHNEMILANEVGDCMCPFYLKVGGKENPIDISKDVISYLLKLGYSPKSFSSKGNCDSKPWKCEYLLNFEINIQSFDDEGNLLITFSHEDSVKKFKNGSKEFNYQLNELGVFIVVCL